MSILHWLLMPRPCYLTHVLRLNICCSGLSWLSFNGFVCFLISGIGFEVIPKVWQFDKSQLSHCSLMFSSDLALAISDAKRLDHETSFGDLGPPGGNDWDNPSSKVHLESQPFFSILQGVA